MRDKSLALILLTLSWAGFKAETAVFKELRVRISWGHASPTTKAFYLKLVPADSGLEILTASGYGLEAGEGLKDGAWQTNSGNRDVDGVELVLRHPVESEQRIENLHIMWADLLAQSDADTARRLSQDAAFNPKSSKLMVQLNPEGTAGFSVTVPQLLGNRALWNQAADVYITAGSQPVPFEEHQREITHWKDRRILEKVKVEPEASYEYFTARWPDMGSPAYRHPKAREPGHVVCLTWDSAIAKFGIDRGGGVWNDYGNPDRFRFWFDFGDLSKGIEQTWKSQSLKDGLPVVTTVFEKEHVRYELEQFAYPLNGPPQERRGDIPMVLLQRVKLTNLQNAPRTVGVSMIHRRQFRPYFDSSLDVKRQSDSALFQEASEGRALFTVQGSYLDLQWMGVRDYQQEQKRMDASVFLDLPASGTREFVVKLPSALVEPKDQERLLSLRFEAARAETLRFWSDCVAKGAQFRVPEKVVNDLFNASLWHSLRLPRRHGGHPENVAIDLPYSNFAYSQTGTPWPVNQAVYVDYMLYDLRGYHSISAEESAAVFRNNQEQNGHLSGLANWVVYTPGMLYAAAKNYLLSGDRALLEKLLPPSLKALDWCLDQIQTASQRVGPSAGLVLGPLNDGTGEGVWAFNQAYMFAGLDLFGRALQQIGHPRSQECLQAARTVRESIAKGFGDAMRRSPLVQLRDHTWIPYVPCEAQTPRRILEQWYATDVDTGALHLLRLKGLPATGSMADSLLNDHEDNLFLNGWGVANEPVYNPQGTAYLLRDDPAAAIRTFYSTMASAFSHSVLEPVEHRWTHGQYFGPPSTDGAWFELYRHMLIHERDDDSLLLGQAVPRKWLENDKKIEIERAPTLYGPLSAAFESQVGSGRILATIQMPVRSKPKVLLVRLRHPERKSIRSVTVNGSIWKDFDVSKEWVQVREPVAGKYEIVVRYD
jgi:hypothetical protein